MTYPTPKEGLFSGLELAADALLLLLPLYCAGKGNPFVDPEVAELAEEVPGVGKD